MARRTNNVYNGRTTTNEEHRDEQYDDEFGSRNDGERPDRAGLQRRSSSAFGGWSCCVGWDVLRRSPGDRSQDRTPDQEASEARRVNPKGIYGNMDFPFFVRILFAVSTYHIMEELLRGDAVKNNDATPKGSVPDKTTEKEIMIKGAVIGAVGMFTALYLVGMRMRNRQARKIAAEYKTICDEYNYRKGEAS